MVVKKIRTKMRNQKVNYVLNDYTDSIILEVPYFTNESDEFEGVHEIMRIAKVEIKDQAKANIIRKFFDKQSLNITYKKNDYNLYLYLYEDFDIFLQIHKTEITALKKEGYIALDLE